MFGHTHVPTIKDIGEGALYVNTGTWVDNNTNYPDAARTFTVITAAEKDTATLYSFAEDGALIDIGEGASK